MTNLEKLVHFMDPYYQDSSDEDLLNAYLTDYVYPECCAAALWYELVGKEGLRRKGIQTINAGAEKFKYSEPGTMQLACEKQAKMYETRCDALTSNGSCAIRVSKNTVAGIRDIPDIGISNVG